MSIEVIDNFLEEDIFNKIQSSFFGSELPWYYYNFKVDELESNGNVLYQSQMVHLFYNENMPSQFLPLVSPIINLLDVASLIKVKANLTTAWGSIERFSSHIDNSYKNAKTAVFYLNDNDGYTEFTDLKERVNSVANRIVIFPSGTNHLGTTHTNSKSRIVLNINFFDGK